MTRLNSARTAGVALLEALVSATCVSIVLGGLMTSAVFLTRTFSAIDNYPALKLHIVDYIALDMRRAKGYKFTLAGGKLTLPLDLTLPNFYEADGRTLRPAQRAIVEDMNGQPKKKHHIFRSTYYVHYGDPNSTLNVRYYLWKNALYRKEGARPATEIASGISEVTFAPALVPPGTAFSPAQMLAQIEANPEIAAQVTFETSRYWRRVPVRLTNATFLRHFFFSPL